MSGKSKQYVPPDQASRDIIADDLARNLLVEAAAGTGKTTSMVGRMIALIRRGVCPVDTLAAVTFTRKAAAELRARFQVGIEKAARGALGQEKARLDAALGRLERCFIGTIHSFCGRLLRERPVEAGVDLAFAEIEPEIDLQFRRQAWSLHVSQLLTRGGEALAELDDVGLEIGDLEGTFLALADYPDVDAWPCDAPPIPQDRLDATKEALATYLRHIEGLCESLPEEAGSDRLIPKYHTLARFRRQRDLSSLPEMMDLLEQFAELPPKAVTLKYWPGGKTEKRGPSELERWNTFCQQHAQPLSVLWRQRRYGPILRTVLPARKIYDDLRRQAGVLNFQDLLMKSAALLRENPNVRQYFRRRFTHLLVDEFQDTDPIQAEVMLLLTADDPRQRDWTKCRPVAGSLFVVGDPKQSIYRFRRADIATYSRVRQIIVSTGGAVVPLTTNFRTVGGLVTWVNRMFSAYFPQAADEYSPQDRPMDAARTDGDGATCSGLFRLTIDGKLNKQQAVQLESDIIARTIRSALDAGLTVPRTEKELAAGVRPQAAPGDFLILTAYHHNMSVYARKLQEYGIPCESTGSSTLNESGELLMLQTCLAAVTRADDPVAAVAALRSELMGVSDADLYAFVKAGGRFYYPQPNVPAGQKWSAQLADAFDRLRRYAGWVATMPALAAVERIADDLGLFAHACAGGQASLGAGSLAKAIELLRSAQVQEWTLSALADLLKELVEGEPHCDGAPARPHDAPAVRIMNLHKAKGLEAPIVFLADPTGFSRHEVKLHVARRFDGTTGVSPVEGRPNATDDRRDAYRTNGTDDRRNAYRTNATGYLAVYTSRGYQNKLVACPAGWDELAAEEEKYQQAERNRLLYVAATRAGAQLIVAQRSDGRGKGANPWQVFEEHLAEAAELPLPGPVAAAAPAEPFGIDEVLAGRAGIEDRWRHSAQPTYAVAAAKAMSVDSEAPVSRGVEHGEEWGLVIHLLLEAAMRNPSADLHALAASALADHDLPATDAPAAVELVRGVLDSPIWRRAQAADRRLSELPLEILPGGTELPTVVRGVIDLAFKEGPQWVIVDYKTDSPADGNLDRLVEHYKGQVETYVQMFQSATGEKVKEKGLLFVRQKKYVAW